LDESAELVDETLAASTRTGEHDLPDPARLGLRHVEVDREADLLGERARDALLLLVPGGRERAREETGVAEGNGQVRDAAEMAVHAQGLGRVARQRERADEREGVQVDALRAEAGGADRLDDAGD